MIVPMARLRILGPRERLADTLRAVQDIGQLHLAEAAPRAGVQPARLDTQGERRRGQLARALADIDDALRALDAMGPGTLAAAASVADCARWARLANRVRRDARALRDRETALDEERALVARYREFLLAVLPIVRKVGDSARLTSHAVVAPASARATVDALAASLREQLGAEFSMTTQQLQGGDLAILLVLPTSFSAKLEARLAEARVPEVPLPEAYRGLPLQDAVPKMIDRLFQIPQEIEACRTSRAALARAHGPELRKAHAALVDWLAAATAHERCSVTPHAFTIEGWIPEPGVPALTKRVAELAGDAVIVERIAREEWGEADAPVVLSNPRLFRPFESLIALLPLPTYG